MMAILADNKPLVVKVLGCIFGILLPMANRKFNLNLSPDEIKMAQGIIVSAILAYGFHQGMSDHGSTAATANIDASPDTLKTPEVKS